MMFQFLSGRRPLNSPASSGTPETDRMPWTGEPLDQRDRGMQDGEQHGVPEHGASTFPQPEACCVERACTAFHEVHSALVGSTEGGVESDRELCALRDQAFQKVRLLPAQTREAVQQKKRVLDVMCEWFSVDNPEVGAFSFEVATEAVALLGGDAEQMCSCHHTHATARSDQARGAERRNPLSWFGRPRSQKTAEPFAN